MKNTLNYILLFSLFISYVSCSDDNDLKGANGRPSFIKTDQDQKGNIEFYYQDKCISKIIEEKGSTIHFEYDNDELISISLSPTDPQKADGNIFIKFSREGNKIIAIKSGDCDSSTEEIELDKNNIPIKMKYKGLYFPEFNDYYNYAYYSSFTFDTQTQKLLKEEIFSENTSDIIYTYTYEYEDSPGIFSEINLPLWFHAYCSHQLRNSTTGIELLFINYMNNISEKNIELLVDDVIISQKINYTYSHNKNGFPNSVTTHNRDEELDNFTASIKY